LGRPQTKLTITVIDHKIKTTIFQFARKNIFYDDYKKEISEASNITTYLHATVTNIEVSENAKQITSVLASNLNGKQFSVKAGHFILAMGGLENPRLLLLSDDVMSCGLGNQNDLVGRFFMEHPHLQSGVYYPSDPEILNHTKLYEIHEKDGISIMGKLTLAEEVLRKNHLLNFTASLHFKSMLVLQETVKSFYQIKAEADNGMFFFNAFKNARNLLRNLDCIAYAGLRKMVGGDKKKWYTHKKKFHGFELKVMSEQAPDPESRVMLDTERDRLGQRKIKLNWKVNSADLHSIRKSQQIIDRELRRSGLGRLEIELTGDEIPERFYGGWHHMGTTRMHNDPKQGVVNEDGKVHGIDNLFVAGSSVFPTGGYANPTLTIVALSVRLADYLKQVYNKLE
jgi:choline dehydrogenase-like flavoprotein